jgi:hypothetical protein
VFESVHPATVSTNNRQTVMIRICEVFIIKKQQRGIIRVQFGDTT